jgi:O-antigen/teichoic acid export membrane protein
MNFRRWVVFTFVVHVLVVLIDKGGGLVLYALTADQKAEHGKAGVAASLPFILGAIANLGLATALVWLVRRGRYAAQTAFETAMAVALGWGGFVAIAAFAVTTWVLPAINPAWAVNPWLLLPICAVVPLLLVASYANSTQLATERIGDYGTVHLVTSLAFLPAFFACFFALGGRVADQHVALGVAWGRLASTLVVAVLTLWLVRKVVALRMRVDRPFLGEAMRFGWRANVTSTLTYLNHRLDLVVLGTLVFHSAFARGAKEEEAEDIAGVQVAYYSIAVTWAELVWHFPEAMRDLFFSKIAGSSDAQARELTPVLSRIGLAVSMAGAAAIVLLMDPMMAMVTMLTGRDADVWYDGWSAQAGAALLLLTPGTVAYTVSKVLQADLAARDRLTTCVYAQGLVFVVMLALDFLWMPSHGALGAAAASTVAYVAGTVFSVVAYARQTGIPAHLCLVVRPADFRYIREILAAVLGKLRGKRA